MWHDNDYSFSDAVAYFSEDGQLEREAEKIIEQERRKQPQVDLEVNMSSITSIMSLIMRKTARFISN